MRISLAELFDNSIVDAGRYLCNFMAMQLFGEELGKIYMTEVISGDYWSDWKEYGGAFLKDIGKVDTYFNSSGDMPDEAGIQYIASIYIAERVRTSVSIYSNKIFAQKRKVEDATLSALVSGILYDVPRRTLLTASINGLESGNMAKKNMEIYFAVKYFACKSMMVTGGACLEELEEQLAEKEQELKELEEKYDGLEERYDALRLAEPEVIKDTKESEALYEELVAVTERLQVANEWLAIHSISLDEGEMEVKEEIYKETLAEFDLSPYKILIIGHENNKNAYPFQWTDITKRPDTIQKCCYVDYVLFDTRFGPHATYWKVKEFCRTNKIPMYHITKRNKDAFLLEAKRLISQSKRSNKNYNLA